MLARTLQVAGRAHIVVAAHQTVGFPRGAQPVRSTAVCTAVRQARLVGAWFGGQFEQRPFVVVPRSVLRWWAMPAGKARRTAALFACRVSAVHGADVAARDEARQPRAGLADLSSGIHGWSRSDGGTPPDVAPPSGRNGGRFVRGLAAARPGHRPLVDQSRRSCRRLGRRCCGWSLRACRPPPRTSSAPGRGRWGDRQ